jgi:hypothetical protein
MQQQIWSAIGVAAGLLVLAACGDSGPGSPGETVAAPTPTEGPIAHVVVEVERCDPEEAVGTVTNNSDEALDMFINVTFRDADGVQVGNRIATARNVGPGESASWDAQFRGIRGYETCQAEISSVLSARGQ